MIKYSDEHYNIFGTEIIFLSHLLIIYCPIYFIEILLDVLYQSVFHFIQHITNIYSNKIYSIRNPRYNVHCNAHRISSYIIF